MSSLLYTVTNALLSQGRILETSPSMGMMGRTYNPKTGKGRWELPIAQVQLSGQLAVTPS